MTGTISHQSLVRRAFCSTQPLVIKLFMSQNCLTLQI